MSKGDDKKLEEELNDLFHAFTKGEGRRVLKLLKAVFRRLLTDPRVVSISHEICDPPPPATTGLPIKTVTIVNGTGYIELIGANDTQPTKPLDKVLARIFRVTDPITAPDPDVNAALNDPRYILGTPDLYGMYYRFQNNFGNMIPGAQAGGNDDNIVMTWARASDDTDWTPALCYRQFIGSVAGGGYGSAGYGTTSSSGSGSSGSGSSSGGP